MISANSQANATRLSHVSMTMACQFLASTAELSVNEIASMMTVTRYARTRHRADGKEGVERQCDAHADRESMVGYCDWTCRIRLCGWTCRCGRIR